MKTSTEYTYHAIAFEPLVDNSKLVHHMILFNCPGIE